ncbi:hypothetical protein ACWD6I_00940 [Streptomyces sp. NPDC002454]
MSELIHPHVTITREGSSAVADVSQKGFQQAGHGELAVEMLRHAGFVHEPSRFPRYRLRGDMSLEYERRQATSAARMLAAAGFRVDLHPSLDTEWLTTPSDRSGRLVHGQWLLRLTDQLNGARSAAEAANLAEHVLDPDDGVLERLSGFFEAAVEWAKESGTDEGWDLSYLFKDAAATINALGEDLHAATDRLRALDPSPSAIATWRAQVTDYYATAPAKPPTTAQPSTESGLPAIPQPAPGRSAPAGARPGPAGSPSSRRR